MEFNLIEILDDFGLQIADQISKNVPKASGRTSKSIEVETRTEGNKTFMSVTGPSYIFELEFGRGKTEKPGTGQVRKSIRQWIDEKGIIPKPNEKGIIPTKDQLSWAIATKIHEKGFKGTPGIITDSIKEPDIINTQQSILEELARASFILFENFQRDLNSVT